MKLVVITTWKCNLKCKHCIFECPKEETLDFNSFRIVIDKLIEKGLNIVSFTGGEPILNPDLFKMINYVSEKGLYYRITSNAIDYKRYLPIIQKNRVNFRYFHFSLDGFEKLHDSIRTKGSFKKVIEAIFFYKLIGIDSVVNFTVNNYNYDTIEKFVSFCSNLGVFGIQISAVLPTKSNEKYQVSFEKREKIYEKLESLSKKYNIKIMSASSLLIDKRLDYCPNMTNNDLTLNQRGELLFCCDIPGSYSKIGVPKSNMEKVFESKEEYFSLIKKDKKFKSDLENSTCYYCYNFFDVI